MITELSSWSPVGILLLVAAFLVLLRISRAIAGGLATAAALLAVLNVAGLDLPLPAL